MKKIRLILSNLFYFIKKNRLSFSFGLIIIMFFFTRLPFFINYRIVGFGADIFGYFKIVEQINNSQLPVFDIRTPGYPLFLKIISIFSDSLIAVVFVQNLISLLCSLFFVYVIYKKYTKYTISVAVALVIFTTSALHLCFDTFIYTESLFINIILLFVSFLILSFNSNKKKYWLLCSTLMMFAIYVRPAGLFLIPVSIIILIYLFINKYSAKIKIYFIAPLIILYILLSSYNYLTVKKFSISPLGGLSIIGTVFSFMETDSLNPQYINETINKVSSLYPPKDRNIIKKSCSIKKIYNSYNSNYGSFVGIIYNDLADNTYYNIPDNKQYIYLIEDLKKIAYGSIKKHPELYTKIVFTMFLHYYTNIFWAYFYDDFLYERVNIMNWDFNHYNSMKYKKRTRCLNSGILSKNVIKLSFKEYLNYDVSKVKDNLKNNSLLRILNHNYTKAHNLLFRNYFWIFIFFTILINSIIKLYKSNFKNKNAFIIFVICSMNIFNAFLVSLVQSTGFRYAFPLEFTYYLSFALSPLIIDYKNIFHKITLKLNIAKQSRIRYK
jgi:hypothetical protein